MSMLTAAAVTPTGIITAVSTLIIAVTGLVGAFAVLIPLLKSQQRTEQATVATHELINGEHTRSLEHQATLEATLSANGIAVPEPAPLTPATDVLTTSGP